MAGSWDGISGFVIVAGNEASIPRNSLPLSFSLNLVAALFVCELTRHDHIHCCERKRLVFPTTTTPSRHIFEGRQRMSVTILVLLQPSLYLATLLEQAIDRLPRRLARGTMTNSAAALARDLRVGRFLHQKY